MSSRQFGNAYIPGLEKFEPRYREHLLADENVEIVLEHRRDAYLLFTAWRILVMDEVSDPGKMKRFMSIPYSSISRFSLRTGDQPHLRRRRLRGEIHLWLIGVPEPFFRIIRGDTTFAEFHRFLAAHIQGSAQSAAAM